MGQSYDLILRGGTVVNHDGEGLRAHHRMHCDFGFFVGATRENTGDLGELERLPGAAGIKVFMGSSTGSLLVADDEGVRNVLKAIRRRASFHAEDEPRLNERKDLRVEGDARSHPVWRDEFAALTATQRLVRLARETGRRVHVLHVSTRQEMEFLKHHKDVASVEVTPHHLTPGSAGLLPASRRFGADESARAGCNAQDRAVARPDAGHRRCARLRSRPARARREGAALSGKPVRHDRRADDRSDHARPCSCRKALVAAPGRSHERGPGPPVRHRKKGRPAVGYDADVTVVDIMRRETITNRWIASRAGWTPYDGVAVTGWPVSTLARGARVMWEGELTTPAIAEAARFLESLASV